MPIGGATSRGVSLDAGRTPFQLRPGHYNLRTQTSAIRAGRAREGRRNGRARLLSPRFPRHRIQRLGATRVSPFQSLGSLPSSRPPRPVEYRACGPASDDTLRKNMMSQSFSAAPLCPPLGSVRILRRSAGVSEGPPAARLNAEESTNLLRLIPLSGTQPRPDQSGPFLPVGMLDADLPAVQ